MNEGLFPVTSNFRAVQVSGRSHLTPITAAPEDNHHTAIGAVYASDCQSRQRIAQELVKIKSVCPPN